MKYEDIKIGMICTVEGLGKRSFAVTAYDETLDIALLIDRRGVVSSAPASIITPRTFSYVEEFEVKHRYAALTAKDPARFNTMLDKLKVKCLQDRGQTYAMYILCYLAEHTGIFDSCTSDKFIAEKVSDISYALVNLEINHPSQSEESNYLTKEEVDWILKHITDKYDQYLISSDADRSDVYNAALDLLDRCRTDEQIM